MQLPVVRLTLPACLKGAENGKLDPKLLVACGLPGFKMVAPAARAMTAMVAAMKDAGFEMTATGVYRSYDRQVALFKQRYTTKPHPGRREEKFEGKTWWLKPGVAGAARPGTSNHGLGLAVDFAEKRDGKTVSISDRAVRWLCKNAAAYGFSAEDQSENWHWRYVAGDRKLPAVEDHHNKGA